MAQAIVRAQIWRNRCYFIGLKAGGGGLVDSPLVFATFSSHRSRCGMPARGAWNATTAHRAEVVAKPQRERNFVSLPAKTVLFHRCLTMF